MSVYKIYNSTIFLKFVMAVSGVILVLFLIFHCLGNLQIFLGQDVFNTYAHFLKSTGELLWVARITLLVMILIHIWSSLKLKFLNMAAKPQGYSVKSYVKSTLYSRTMIWTGIMIALLVTYHLLHYTAMVTNPEYATYEESYGPRVAGGSVMLESEDGTMKTVSGEEGIFERHDAYKMVIKGFSNPLVSIVYILFVLMVGFHLSHAVQSMFQTLGWNGSGFVRFSKILGWGLFLAYASIPIGIWIFGYGKGVIQ